MDTLIGSPFKPKIENIKKEFQLESKTQKRFTIKLLINSILFSFGIGIGFFVYSQRKSNNRKVHISVHVVIPSEPVRTSTNATPTVMTINPTGEITFNTYTSLRYLFSFEFPSTIKLITQTPSNNQNTVDASFVSQDAHYNPQTGWATSGVQLKVIVDTPQNSINAQAIQDNSFLPLSSDQSKMTFSGYSIHGNGIGYMANIATSHLADTFAYMPAVVSFVCFSPQSDVCKTLLFQIVNTFRLPQ